LILVDSNILAAVLNERDNYHQRANDLLDSVDVDLLVSPLVIDEVAHLLTHRERRWDAQTALLASFGDEDGLTLAELTDADVARMAELSGQYESARIDATDLSIVALAERLGVTQVATFDRRDFAIVRPSHVEAFTLLP
jgi:predicted nucleic acid-binding protein